MNIFLNNKTKKMKKTTTQKTQKPQPKKAVAKKSTETLVKENKKSIFSVVINEKGDASIEYGGNSDQLTNFMLAGCETDKQLDEFITKFVSAYMVFQLKKTILEANNKKEKRKANKAVAKKVAKKK